MSHKKLFLSIIGLLVLCFLSIVRVDAVCSKNLPSNTCDFATTEQCEKLRNNLKYETVLSSSEIEVKENKEIKTTDYSFYINEDDVKTLGNVVYGEARGLNDTEKSAVVWCILNRLDDGHFGKTIYEVTSAKYQFSGYVENRTYKSEATKALLKECEDIARDVLIRYYMEKDTNSDVGRTLPSTYLYFHANKNYTHNMYSETWHGTDYWDWSLTSPYDK